MVRTSGDVARHQRQAVGYTHRGGVQPPAGEAHVDFTPARAEPLARAVYAQTFPEGQGFARFIASSLWRAFSPPPQDCPGFPQGRTRESIEFRTIAYFE